MLTHCVQITEKTTYLIYPVDPFKGHLFEYADLSGETVTLPFYMAVYVIVKYLTSQSHRIHTWSGYFNHIHSVIPCCRSKMQDPGSWTKYLV